jgi:membrane-bound lytic murein transglycosylase D
LASAAEALVVDLLKETSAVPESAAKPAGRTYLVRAGDTLSGIARKTGTTIAQLKNWNKMRGTRLNIGDRLIVGSAARKNANQ